MITIDSVTPQSSPAILEQTRGLFRAYGEFLRDNGGPALLCFSRLEEETSHLPEAYTENGGEVLLATDGSRALGCVAYCSLNSVLEPGCCEIKRLFIRAEARGQGLGRQLVVLAMERARRLGYETACLDTEPRSMAAARDLYLDLGFIEDVERNSKSRGGPVLFFKKSLRSLPASGEISGSPLCK